LKVIADNLTALEKFHFELDKITVRRNARLGSLARISSLKVPQVSTHLLVAPEAIPTSLFELLLSSLETLQLSNPD
jgi:hypothetical protein